MTETRTPLDQALDLLVYAPLGLALAARDELPKLIDRGRSQGTSQVALARMLGEMAVGKGQLEARRVAEQFFARFVNGRKGGDSPTSEPPARSATPEADLPARPKAAAKPAPKQGRAAARSPKSPASVAEDLAIPGYDALSAPQVVQRLSGLSPEELEAVGAYETGTRHRQTILGRISQLQSGS